MGMSGLQHGPANLCLCFLALTTDVMHQSLFMSALSAHPDRSLSVCWEQHCKLLPGVAGISASTVAKWTIDEVRSEGPFLRACCAFSPRPDARAQAWPPSGGAGHGRRPQLLTPSGLRSWGPQLAHPRAQRHEALCSKKKADKKKQHYLSPEGSRPPTPILPRPRPLGNMFFFFFFGFQGLRLCSDPDRLRGPSTTLQR